VINLLYSQHEKTVDWYIKSMKLVGLEDVSQHVTVSGATFFRFSEGALVSTEHVAADATEKTA
jgi:hypothetical protein